MRLIKVMHIEKESFWEPSYMHTDIRNHMRPYNNIRENLNCSSWVIYNKMITIYCTWFWKFGHGFDGILSLKKS